MLGLIILVFLFAWGVYTGWRSADEESPQWPKALWAIAGLLGLVGLGIASAFMLPRDQGAAMMMGIAMFGPLVMLLLSVMGLGVVVEVLVRHHRRRREKLD